METVRLSVFSLWVWCLGLLKNDESAIEKSTGWYCEASLSLPEAAVGLKLLLVYILQDEYIRGRADKVVKFVRS